MADSEWCQFCGDKPAVKQCSVEGCSRKRLCEGCDEIWHGHPARKDHQRIYIQRAAVSHLSVLKTRHANEEPANEPKNFGQPIRSQSTNQPVGERYSSRLVREPGRQTDSRHSPEGPSVRAQESVESDSRNYTRFQNTKSHDPGQLTGLSWTCPHCTFISGFSCKSEASLDDRITCKVCSRTSSLEEVCNSLRSETGKLLCLNCTLMNDLSSTQCEGCNKPLYIKSGDNAIGDSLSEFNSRAGDSAATAGTPIADWSDSGDIAASARSSAEVHHNGAGIHGLPTPASHDVGATPAEPVNASLQCQICTFKNSLTASACEICANSLTEASSADGHRNMPAVELDQERKIIDSKITELIDQGFSYESASRLAGEEIKDITQGRNSQTYFNYSSQYVGGTPAAQSVRFCCFRCNLSAEEAEPFQIKICGCRLCADCFRKVVENLRNKIFSLLDVKCYCRIFVQSQSPQELEEHYLDVRQQIVRKLGDGNTELILNCFDSLVRHSGQRTKVQFNNKFACSRCKKPEDLSRKIQLPHCACAVCPHCFDEFIVKKLLTGCRDKYDLHCPGCFRCLLRGEVNESLNFLQDQIFYNHSLKYTEQESRTAVNNLVSVSSESRTCSRCFHSSCVAPGTRIFQCLHVSCYAFTCCRCRKQAERIDFCSHCDRSSQPLLCPSGHPLERSLSGYGDWCKVCLQFIYLK